MSLSHFKSSMVQEQQVLSRETLPPALEESYSRCYRPPLLNEFTKYRDDEKEGLKFYTDPTYFYRLWVENQNKELERKKKKVGVLSRILSSLPPSLACSFLFLSLLSPIIHFLPLPLSLLFSSILPSRSCYSRFSVS